MLELLFLLLPIAAGYGWYMGRRSVRQDTQQQSNQFSRQYVAGLNYLLSDESDKAVDLFIQLLEVDSETIETHLSLGNKSQVLKRLDSNGCKHLFITD